VSAVGCIGLFGRDRHRGNAERATTATHNHHRSTGNLITPRALIATLFFREEQASITFRFRVRYESGRTRASPAALGLWKYMKTCVSAVGCMPLLDFAPAGIPGLYLGSRA
jgi:hypothetical protein